MGKIKIILLSILCVISSAAYAVESKHGIQIQRPWARESTGTTGAVFMTINNLGIKTDKLVGASSDVCKIVELHTHVHEGNIKRMRPVDSIAIQAGGTAKLERGGDHVMLIGLNNKLKKDDVLHLQLEFENAGIIDLEVPIKSIAYAGNTYDCQCNHDESKEVPS